MTRRKKKKLENRAGFFHYRDYKLRVKLLYHAIDVVMKSSAAYAFKVVMFEHFKGLLLGQVPKKICDQNLRYKPFLTNCDGTLVGRHADIAKPDVIPSMSMRMVGDKIHSFSIDEDSFKNGYKPDELAPPLPKGPLDGHKSMSSAKLSAIHNNPTMASAKLTIEHGDTDRMSRQIMADEYIKGGSAIEYPSSATIDLRKAVGRYGNMSIKGNEEDVSEPIHLGPIDLGPTDGERIEEHLLQSEDKKRRFASNACEASAYD
jgi:hypothetical protein